MTGKSLANFLGDVSYAEAIAICCDNDSVLAAVVTLAKDISTKDVARPTTKAGLQQQSAASGRSGIKPHASSGMLRRR